MRLKIAFMDNPRIQPLLEGSVRPDGVELEWELGHPATQFRQHLADDASDVFEFSVSDFMIVRDTPALAHLRWTALPVFLQKALLILGLHVNVRSGIRELGDLRGKRVGMPDYQMAAGVWLRIVLRHLHGIHPQEVTWVNGRPASLSHGAVEGLDHAPLAGVNLIRLEEGQSLNELLQRGEVDAAFGDSRTVPITEGPNVRKLFDPASSRQLIADVLERTGTTPINHLVLMQQRLGEQHPELPLDLYQAFERSKQEAYRRARAAAGAYLLFAQDDFAHQAALLGDDPYPSGLAANRRMLELVAEELVEDGLIRERPNVDSLFPEALQST